MNKIKQFFWYCSGAEVSLLEQCDTESNKYAGIGATIFFTGIFAAGASGYAAWVVFNSYWVATIVGLIWGLMIFNLDRFIVSSMRKTRNGRRELVMAIPRLVIAILISIVIARPLELKLFEQEIDAELAVMEQEQALRRVENVQMKFTSRLNELRNEQQVLQRQIDNKTIERDQLNEEARKEADGTGGTMLRNPGPIYKIKKAQADQVDAELQELRQVNAAKIATIQQNIDEMLERQTYDISSLEAISIDGMASRLTAHDRLKQANEAVWYASWFIMLLFIVIETAPVTVKLLANRGAYDELLEQKERLNRIVLMQDLAVVSDKTRKKADKFTSKEQEFVYDGLQVEMER